MLVQSVLPAALSGAAEAAGDLRVADCSRLLELLSLVPDASVLAVAPAVTVKAICPARLESVRGPPPWRPWLTPCHAQACPWAQTSCPARAMSTSATTSATLVMNGATSSRNARWCSARTTGGSSRCQTPAALRAMGRCGPGARRTLTRSTRPRPPGCGSPQSPRCAHSSYQIITSEGATIASTVTYLLPVVAIVLGVLVLSESVTVGVVAGVVLVLCGVGLTRKHQADRRSAD
jgi:hypothetical protein